MFCGFKKNQWRCGFVHIFIMHIIVFDVFTVGSWKYIVFSNEFCVFVVSKHLFLLTVFLWKIVFRVGFGRPKCHSFVLLLAVSYSLRFFDKALLVKVSNEACWLECQWVPVAPLPHTSVHVIIPSTHPRRISVNVWWNDMKCVCSRLHDDGMMIAWWNDGDDMMVMIEWHDVRRTECYHPPHPPTPPPVSPRTLPAYLCQRMMKCVSSRLHDDGIMIAWWNDGDDMIACQRMMKKWARLHGRFSGRQHKYFRWSLMLTAFSRDREAYLRLGWWHSSDANHKGTNYTPPKTCPQAGTTAVGQPSRIGRVVRESKGYRAHTSETLVS